MPFRRFFRSSTGFLPGPSSGYDRAVRHPDRGAVPAVRRFIIRRRRLLALLACCAAAGFAVEALAPADAERAAVVRAARDLPVGSVLESGSLETVQLPAEAVPPGAYEQSDAVVGRRLATPLRRGSPVTELSLAGSGLLAGAPPGTVAIPLRPADPSVLDLLGPGQLVTVVAGADNTAAQAGAGTGAAGDGNTAPDAAAGNQGPDSAPAAGDAAASDGPATDGPASEGESVQEGGAVPGSGPAAGNGNGRQAGAAADVPGGAAVLASSVPVLWVSGGGGSVSGWPGQGDGEGLVVVAADRENAARLTAASGAGSIYLLLVP